MCAGTCFPIFLYGRYGIWYVLSKLYVYLLRSLSFYYTLASHTTARRPGRAAPEREARTRGALHGEMKSWLEEAEALLEHSIAREVARSNGSSCRPRRRAVRRVHALRPTPTEAAFALRRAEELHGHSKSALSEAVRAGEAREASFRHELLLARGDTLDCRKLS